MRCLHLAPLALLLGACSAAASNPDRDQLRPVSPPPQAEERQDGAEHEAAPENSTPMEQLSEYPTAAELWEQQIPIVGIVGDRPVELPRFLSLLWMRETAATRDVLEQLVMSRLTILEAERFGMYLAPEDVDVVLESAYEAMRERLKEAGSTLTVEEHIRRNLEMDPGFYHSHLRDQAIVQLLAERCVRAWAMENGRADVRLLELDSDGAEEARRALAAGGTFDELAEKHGEADRLVIVRAENQEISRLAFATDVGDVAGPIVQGGRFLLMMVDRREEGIEGGWPVLGPRVEKSLVETQIEQREFVQWRSAMVRRYRVDLQPFLDLVGDPGPGS